MAGCGRRQAMLLLHGLPVLAFIQQPAEATQLPDAADKAWEALGGGPADLIFPPSFLAVWNVESVLVSVELPFGPDYVGDLQAVRRAEAQDKGRRFSYQASFVLNHRDQVVIDRRFNTASLMHTYLGLEADDLARRIQWRSTDPNYLDMTLPNGMHIETRVTKRSEDWTVGEDRLETSEFFQQVLEFPRGENRELVRPKVKASQVYTKYHWRSTTESLGGPEIVATQVLCEFANSFSGDTGMLMMAAARGKPVTVYTYRMSFSRA